MQLPLWKRLIVVALGASFLAVLGCQKYYATDPETGKRREISRDEYKGYQR